jgi:phosphoglycerate dehydrogenase-like enzyme
MEKFVVVYTDPAWARTRDGGSDPKRASIEREIFGDCCEIRIATAQSGRYPTDGPGLSELVRGADALVIYRVEISPALLADAGNQLKVVARQGVGFDNLHPQLLRARGIVGFNVPDYCVDEVTAHTVGLILALERGIVVQHAALASGRFDVYHGGVPRRLRALTAGVVGFGRIGRVVAARLRNFYGRVVACDPLVEADQVVA